MNFSALVNSNIAFPEGQENFGGISKVYYGFLADADETQWPEPADSPTSFALAITIALPIVMLATKKMNTIYVTPETSGLDGETQGERDAESTKRTAEFFFPQPNADSLGFARVIQNRRMFFIFEDMKGQLRLLGSPRFPAKCSANDTSGKASTDRPGITFKVEDIGSGPAPIYTAAIPLTPAV
jgi:hypothetical protein